MIASAEFTTFPHDAHLQSNASEMGLAIPEIQIADKLQIRLGRKDRVLGVDSNALWAGVQDVELENKLQIQVDSLPKNAEVSDPTIDYQSNSGFLLRVGNGNNMEKGFERKVNTVFWLGVLATDELAEGNRKEYEKRAKLFGSIRSKITLGGAATNIVLSATEMLSSLEIPDSIHLPIAGLTAGYIYDLVKYAYALNRGDDLAMKEIEKDKRDLAASFGKKYQVLNYEDTLELTQAV